MYQYLRHRLSTWLQQTRHGKHEQIEPRDHTSFLSFPPLFFFSFFFFFPLFLFLPSSSLSSLFYYNIMNTKQLPKEQLGTPLCFRFSRDTFNSHTRIGGKPKKISIIVPSKASSWTQTKHVGVGIYCGTALCVYSPDDPLQTNTGHYDCLLNCTSNCPLFKITRLNLF